MSETPEKKISRRSRFWRDTENLPPLALTERDLAVLRAIGDYQLLSAPQIQALYFRSLQKARKRLFRLWQHRLLERRFGLAELGQGAPPALYGLSHKGAHILVTKGGAITKATLGATLKGRASPLFYEHTLRRNDFRIALTLACRGNPDLQLLFWKQDKSIKEIVTFLNGKAANSPVLRKVPLLADGFFGLQAKENKRYFFVEIDRGTTAHSRLLLKLKGYYHLWSERRHVQRYGIESFRVLYVTSSKERMEHLIQTAQKVRNGLSGSGLFLFSTFDRISLEQPECAIGLIWKKSTPTNGNEYPLFD